MKPEHLEISTIDPAPKGGQQCGVRPYGVKVVHTPTGLSASCYCERSQTVNKKIAMEMLEWGLEVIGWKDEIQPAGE